MSQSHVLRGSRGEDFVPQALLMRVSVLWRCSRSSLSLFSLVHLEPGMVPFHLGWCHFCLHAQLTAGAQWWAGSVWQQQQGQSWSSPTQLLFHEHLRALKPARNWSFLIHPHLRTILKLVPLSWFFASVCCLGNFMLKLQLQGFREGNWCSPRSSCSTGGAKAAWSLGSSREKELCQVKQALTAAWRALKASLLHLPDVLPLHQPQLWFLSTWAWKLAGNLLYKKNKYTLNRQIRTISLFSHSVLFFANLGT